MTFDRFLARYPPLERAVDRGGVWSPGPPGFDNLLSQYGGSSFDHGLYRLHTAGSAERANEAVGEFFPAFAGSISCFGYDWLGRQFACDIRAQGRDQVLLPEPGTGEVLEVPVTFQAFHDELLVDEPEAPLASSFFGAWRDANPAFVPLAPDTCVGYRIPLFLGGQDDMQNLETIDLWVYWSLMGQLRHQTANLPPGTRMTPSTSTDIGAH